MFMGIFFKFEDMKNIQKQSFRIGFMRQGRIISNTQCYMILKPFKRF